MAQTSEVLSAYASLLSTSQTLVSSSAELLGDTSRSAEEVLQAANEGKDSIDSLSGTMSTTTQALQDALEK